MIRPSSLHDRDIADIAGCGKRTISRIRANIRTFGTPCAPKATSGQGSRILPHVLDALLDHLLVKPDLYFDEMAEFIWDEFNLSVSTDNFRRSLKVCNWSKKKTQRVACERDPDLRDACLRELSEYQSYQLAFVDESGCDTLAGVRRTGWAPRGMHAVQTARFHREERHQILPACTQNGVIHTRIFQGFTDGEFFVDLIRELLLMCGRWPEPNSVLRLV
jgi:transposase